MALLDVHVRRVGSMGAREAKLWIALEHRQGGAWVPVCVRAEQPETPNWRSILGLPKQNLL